MKAPSLAPVYVLIYVKLCEAARSCGYALAVHGTFTRDLDVVAVPWTEEATSADDLVRKMAESVAWRAGEDPVYGGPIRAPHGRLSWSIPYRFGADDPMDPGYVDVSVMPRLAAAAATAPVAIIEGSR